MNDKENREGTPVEAKNAPLVNDEGLEESNVAKRLRLTGEEIREEDYGDIPRNFRSRLGNFWYHHKTKLLIAAFFTFAIGVAVGQYVRQSNPDVYILYAGPEYITANENQKFCATICDLMTEDFNGDGEKKARLTDIIYSTQNQMEKAKAEAEARGDEFSFDALSNQSMEEKFSYEVFGSDAVICILSEEQYEQVAASDGFLPLREIFGDEEIPGAIDDYGVRFSETRFYAFYESARIFPEDAVLAIRRVSTMSALTGRKKAEKSHAYHLEIFKKIVNFEFPEGYVPENAE